MSTAEARELLARLLERHGSWQVVAVLLGESVEHVVAVYGGARPSPMLERRLLAQRIDPPTPRSIPRP